MQPRLAARHRRHRLQQLGFRHVFQHIAQRARADHLLHLLVFCIAREHEHVHGGIACANRANGVGRGQARHLQVHEHEVRLEPRGHVHRLVAIGGFADDAHTLHVIEQGTQAFTHDRVIVDQQDSNCRLVVHRSSRGNSITIRVP